jgi:hypothetical protein
MLYVITSDLTTTFVCKALNKKDAMHKFMVGMEPDTYRNLTGHPTFQVRELTLELLEEITPDEFLITEHTDF